MDALGSAIRVDSRGREVMRILPRVNEAINEEWISDKTRHVVDGLKTQRLDRPYVRVDGKLDARDLAGGLRRHRRQGRRRRKPERIGAIAGDLASVEEMFALKASDGQARLANIDCRQDGSKLHPKFGRASYLFNSTIAGIDEADAIMIIGSNPRLEAPVLNARIRKRWLRGRLPDRRRRRSRPTSPISTIISAPGRTSLARLRRSSAGQQGSKPMFILGAGAFARPDGAAVLALAAKAANALGVVKDGWNGFNVLHTRGVARRRPRSRPRAGRGRARRARRWRRPARSTSSSTSAPTKSTSSPAPSSSTSARMATAARIAPTSSCRAPPTPRRPALTSTPRAGRNSPSARCSRRATRARIGRSCARCRSALGAQAAVRLAQRSCARRSPRAHPHLVKHRRRSRRPTRSAIGRHRRRRSSATAPFALADRRLLSHQPDRARLARHGRMLGPGARLARPRNRLMTARSRRAGRSPSSHRRRRCGRRVVSAVYGFVAAAGRVGTGCSTTLGSSSLRAGEPALLSAC